VTEPESALPEATTGAWSALRPGTKLSIVKLAPDGSEAARYAGEVAAGIDGDGWTVVSARWTHGTMELDGLELRTGDHLLEWFSPRHSVNAFAVMTANGRLKGWYANVTHPARLDLSTDPPTLIWHDLFVDLVGLPDKTFTMRDDDELEASGLHHLDPELHGIILEARGELIRRFEREEPPFAALSERVRSAAQWYERASDA
jgi:Protein of unknown function (DUF402)